MVSDPPSDKSTVAQYQAKQQRKGEEYTRSDWSDPENITVYAGPSDVVQATLQSRRSLSIEVTLALLGTSGDHLITASKLA